MSQIGQWLKGIFKNPETVSTALTSMASLTAPSARQPDHSFHDLRARLQTKNDDTVRRTLALILLRARANKSQPILRSLPQLAPRRDLAVEITMKTARHDVDFMRHAKEGNKARDARDWSRGIEAYSKALELYPLHRGYLVQLSHCFKENERFQQAEVGYRDALALGAPLTDVWPHLELTVHYSGGGMRIYPPDLLADLERNAAGLKNQLSTSDDLRTLAWLFMGAENFDLAWTIRMLRSAPRLTQIVEHLMADPMFSRANRRLLALAGRGGFS